MTITLNGCLSFTFADRFNIAVKFVCEGAARDFDLSLKLRRRDSYLENATRTKYGANRGKLVPNIEYTTLVQRHGEANEAMKMKRNKLNPKSQDLTGEVKRVVSELENGFDRYSDEHKSPTVFGSEWKGKALTNTRGEIPPIALTGHETGPVAGFGSTIYFDHETKDKKTDMSATSRLPPMLMKANGTWNGDVELRSAIMQANPLLPRSGVLCDASGRYSEDIMVPGGLPHASNPTGMRESGRSTLRVIPAKDLDRFLREEASPSQLVVVACLREDDPLCRKAEMVVEQVHGAILRGELDNADTDLAATGASGAGATANADNSQYRIIKVAMSESRFMAEQYKIRSLPAFLMFSQSKLVYAGALGGTAVRVAPEVKPWRVLCVEPNFRDQMSTEKMLRKHKYHWDLCMNAAQAAQHKQRANEAAVRSGEPTAGGYDLVLLSDSLPSDEVAMIERNFKSMANPSSKRVLICGFASVTGETGAAKVLASRWSGRKKGITFDADVLLEPRLASVVDVAVTKPLKGTALEDLAEHLDQQARAAGGSPYDQHYKGLTKGGLVAQMAAAAENARRGQYIADGAVGDGSDRVNKATAKISHLIRTV